MIYKHIKQKHRTPLTLLIGGLLTFVMLLGVAALINQNRHAHAAPVTGFQPGNIMSDAVFTNKNSMSASQIQSFLNARVPYCDTQGTKPSEYGGGTRRQYAASRGVSTPFTCLRNYSQGGKSAARIIYDAAQEFNINPQVLIVLLQKEQGLVTDEWPWPIQYRSATGYGCPDTAACDSQYYGLTNQVRWAARMFRAIMNNTPTWYTPYKLGNNNIYWHPDLSRCGSSTVNIQNRATVALYSYTPYRPNQAALNAGYGTGNSCSSYGNRNFYQYFKDWFGSTTSYQRITPVIYDGTTDKSGERAKIGFRLSNKPTHNVIIEFGVSSPSNARIVGNGKVTITPNNWNKPRSNTIEMEGLNNPHASTIAYYALLARNITSTDSRYGSLPASSIDRVPLVNLPVGNVDVYRLYSSQTGKHYFTSDTREVAEMSADGWRNEGVRFRGCEAGASTAVRLVNTSNGSTRIATYQSSQLNQALTDGYAIEKPIVSTSSVGNIPVYWMYDSVRQRSLYTTSTTEGISSGFTNRGVVFHACSRDSKAVYRMYRPSVGNHFFSIGSAERNRAVSSLGFRYENVGFYVCEAGNSDVYRLYKPSTKNHMFTRSVDERNRAVSVHGFRDEGMRFRICSSDDRDIYRLYRQRTGSHFFTASAAERDNAVRNEGFRYEGVMLKAL